MKDKSFILLDCTCAKAHRWESEMEKSSMQSYLNHDISCGCGKKHSCNIREIEVSSAAIKKLPEWINKYGFTNPLFVYDETTYKLAGAVIEGLIEAAQIKGKTYILPWASPVADTSVCGLVDAAIAEETDLIVAVGSGTINDVCRYVSFKRELPYFIVGTAPSMDGYASNVSPLIVNNMKVTYTAQIPMAIIGDCDMLKAAPMDMIAAGVGDILGKYTCLMDWKIAHIVTGEYYCDMLGDLVEKAIATVVSNIDGLAARDEEAVKGVMEGLILSGIAMSFAGNSRPASGSEHHLSHYWEMMFLFEEKPPVFHGAKVGIGTIQVMRMYEKLLGEKIDFEAAVKKAETFDIHAWKNYMQEAYGQAANEVIELEEAVHKNSSAEVAKRVYLMQENWEKLQELMKTLPDPKTVEAILLKLEGPVKAKDVGISDRQVTNAVRAAKELRNRFGLLQMLFDFGLADEYSQWIINE